jgi:hypothetical protein
MGVAAGRQISWAKFKEALRTNPNIRFFPSVTTLGAMVYFYAPDNEDSDERGLWEIMAVQSPTFFNSVSFEDFVTEEGKWVRGYNSFFQKTLKMIGPDNKPLFDANKVKTIIPDAYNPWHGSKEVKDKFFESLVTPQQKQALKLRAASKRIEGYGDPIGGKRETNTVYSF